MEVEWFKRRVHSESKGIEPRSVAGMIPPARGVYRIAKEGCRKVLLLEVWSKKPHRKYKCEVVQQFFDAFFVRFTRERESI